MFAYHLAWDLAFYDLVDPALQDALWFKWFGHAIAAAFLGLSGAGLVLAFRRPAPWPGFWRRLGMISAAAAVVTLASLWFSPQAPIFFGILHAIALSSLLAVPLVRAPIWQVVAAALALLLPAAFGGFPGLNHPALSWTGLGTIYPLSEDFRPLFPWGGLVFLGMAAARILPLPQGRVPGSLGWLAWMGRHSLAIYLVHQPLLVGMVALMAAVLTPPQPSRGFTGQCQIQCEATGGARARCSAACACVVGKLKAEDLWSRVEAGALTATEQARVSGIALQCSGQVPR